MILRQLAYLLKLKFEGNALEFQEWLYGVIVKLDAPWLVAALSQLGEEHFGRLG